MPKISINKETGVPTTGSKPQADPKKSDSTKKPALTTGSKPQADPKKSDSTKKPAPKTELALKENEKLLWAIVALLVLALLIGLVAGRLFFGRGSTTGDVIADNSQKAAPDKGVAVNSISADGKDATDEKGVAPVPTEMPVMPTATISAPAALEIPEADNLAYYKGEPYIVPDFRYAVGKPGDSAVFVLVFKNDANNAIIRRIWPDDMLVSAEICMPGQGCFDLKDGFEMIFVPTDGSGTGNPKLDATMADRHVNIAAGELLPQNTNAFNLGNVPAGSYIRITVKDNADKAVNVGLGMVLETNAKPDEFTVDLK